MNYLFCSFARVNIDLPWLCFTQNILSLLITSFGSNSTLIYSYIFALCSPVILFARCGLIASRLRLLRVLSVPPCRMTVEVKLSRIASCFSSSGSKCSEIKSVLSGRKWAWKSDLRSKSKLLGTCDGDYDDADTSSSDCMTSRHVFRGVTTSSRAG